MTKEKASLLEEFKKISNKKWIKSINNNHSSVGLTFENELGKKADSLFFPDYNGIEIKCTTFFSKYPLYLFTIAFDGPSFPEINRLIELYGHEDKDYNEKKVLFTKLCFNSYNEILHKYLFKLNIIDDKLYLEVYDKNYNLIERKSFVYLDSIKKHIIAKLNDICYITAYKKKEDNEIYFRYSKLKLYKLRSIDTFFDLLKNDIIKIDLIARVNKSGNDAGRYRNKNLVFSINKDKISQLFEEEFDYNHDYQDFHFFQNKKASQM